MQERPTSQAGTDYLYVLVCRDISQPHLSVQVAHAAIAATHAFHEYFEDKPHPHLVVCGVTDESELLREFNLLKEMGVPCCLWREDDLGNRATSLATAPLRGKARKPLSGYSLLR